MRLADLFTAGPRDIGVDEHGIIWEDYENINGPDRMIGRVEKEAIEYLNAALEHFADCLRGEQND